MRTSTPPSPSSVLAHVRPTRRTLFWRQFLPWQVVRFLVINLRMTRMIRRSHDHPAQPRALPDPDRPA